MSTTYYGLCIAWHGEMKHICDEYNIDFEEAVTDWNKGYNKGMRGLNKSDLLRPILYPPNHDAIGGHCVVPNAILLRKIFDSKALDLIIDYDKSYT
jgi:hypothetical protein